MRILLFILLLMIWVNPISAQDSTSTKVRDQLEEVFEEVATENGDSGEQLIQFLQELESNPVNINTADINELLQIPGITFVIARSIISYRENELFVEKSDVLKVPGIGPVTYQKISPYIIVGGVSYKSVNEYFDPTYWLDNSRIEFISRYQQTIEDQVGYLTPDSLGGYVGNPVKYYQRLKLRSDHLSFNLTQEKDAGEALNGLTGFDFNSVHFGLLNNGKVRTLIIGDYSLSFGQGLVLWSGGAFGKGREVIKSIGRNERGLRPYTSAQESNFFRGIAATVGNKNELTVFYSNVSQSASVVGIDSVRFPSSSGFHRTLNEVDRRDNLDQTTIGGRFRLDTKIGLFGLSGYSSTFSTDIIRGNLISSQNDFNGTTNSVVGADYRALIGRSLIIGEFGISNVDSFAGIIGIESSVGANTDLAILYRNYSSDYISIFGNGFSESSGMPQNERGLYVGLKHQISRITLSTYFDQYYFDAPNGSVTIPSGGVDVLGMIETNFTSSLSGYFLIRNETKDDTFELIDELGREVQQLGSRTRISYRIQLQHQPTRTFRSRSRIEWVRFQSDELGIETGFLIYQDARIALTNNLLLDARFTVFDTESFNARVYQFEICFNQCCVK
jgi:competence ComEA-like helix-hairpin-helix protein